jgi:hypothetical protein
MKSFSFEELSEAAQQNAINLYYADSDYQEFIEEVQKVNADEMPGVEDWAREKNIRFDKDGQRRADLVSETMPSGHVINYKIVSETYYHEETPDRVVLLLEQSRQNKTRLKITYGDLKTGRVWDDKPFFCHVGRSTGRIKIPLAIKTARSTGGERLLDDCIVKIEYTRKTRNGGRPLWDVTGRGYEQEK